MDAKEASARVLGSCFYSWPEINHSLPRASQPLGPGKIFEKFFQIPKVAAFAGLKRGSSVTALFGAPFPCRKQDLETMSTTQLHDKLRRAGWRSEP